MSIARQRKFVDFAVQGGIVARLVAYWFATVGISLSLAMVIGWFSNPLAPLAQQWARQMQLIWPLLLATFMVLPIAVLGLVRFTHRFAGPVLRLRRCLNDLADGRAVAPLKFRKGDFWPELADAFNRVVAMKESLQTRPRSLRAELADSEARDEEVVGV